MKIILTFFFILPFLLFSQEEKPEYNTENQMITPSKKQHPDSLKNKIYDFPDVEAQFPGGNTEMKKYINDNLHYSEIDFETIANGKIFVGFIVNIDGSIENVKVLRGIAKELDEEFVRVVKGMPNWIPGEVNGEKVRSRGRIPFSIHFQ